MEKTPHWATRVLALFGICFILMASSISPIAYNLIENASSPLTQRSVLNFTGTGVSCADNSGAKRTDCTINGTGVENYAQSFSSQTSVILTHNLGTTSVLTQCFDSSTPPNQIIPANIANTDSNDVTVTFSVAQSGSCIVNGAAAGTATSVPFSGLTSSTNTTAAMVVGAGASLTISGSGYINANKLHGISFSATPAFTFTGGSAETFTITLTGNVTSSTATGMLTGEQAVFEVCQDSSGLHTLVWPASFHGAMTIGLTASLCSAQSFIYDGSLFYATSLGVINQ
jgi:hypothetical protein